MQDQSKEQKSNKNISTYENSYCVNDNCQDTQCKRAPFYKSTWFRMFTMLLALNAGILVMTTVFSYIQVQNELERFVEQQDFALGLRRQGIWLIDEIRIQKHDNLVNEFKNNIAMASMGGFLIGIIISAAGATILSRTYTKPLKKLSRSIQDVIDKGFKRNQDLQTLDSNSTNEINELIAKYNRLIIKLKDTEELRENLVSDVSHELKTPLTRLRGIVEGIEDKVYKANKETLDTLINDIEHLEKMTERLQRMTQLKAGREHIVISEVNIASLVNEIVKGRNNERIDLIIEVPKKLTVQADKSLLKELLDNLISNAFKYTEKGVVKIKADESSIEIHDSGVGIAKEDIQLVFERFYRVDKSRATHTGGLGLGLPISKEICELLGWKLTVKSEIGKGSVFTIKTSK